MSLLVSIRSEILKTKRTASFYLTVAAAAFGPLMSMLDILLDGLEPGDRDFIFNKFLTTKFQMTGFVMLPEMQNDNIYKHEQLGNNNKCHYK